MGDRSAPLCSIPVVYAEKLSETQLSGDGTLCQRVCFVLSIIFNHDSEQLFMSVQCGAQAPSAVSLCVVLVSNYYRVLSTNASLKG